jgi:hypothetical protein
MRTIVHFLVFLLPLSLLSQTNLPVDTADITEYDPAFIPYNDHFFIEYLDFKLAPTSKENAQLKRHIFYQKDKKCKLYPTNLEEKEDYLLLENKEVKSSDAMILMNGLFKTKDKTGKVYEEILYVNGFIQKIIRKRDFISEVSEYDYSRFPFRLHYIKYGKQGDIITNYFALYDNKTWTYEKTTALISDDIFAQPKVIVDTSQIAGFDHSATPYTDIFLIEHLDTKLNPTLADDAQLKRYTFYQKGKKCKLYPTNSIPKKDKLFLNNREVKNSDSLALMNGVFKLKDKSGRTYEEILYVNGYIKKHILKTGSLWHPRHKGKAISEIAEYDYTTFPFRLHYIKYGKKRLVISNYYIKYDNGAWILQQTNSLISSDITHSDD